MRRPARARPNTSAKAPPLETRATRTRAYDVCSGAGWGALARPTSNAGRPVRGAGPSRTANY